MVTGLGVSWLLSMVQGSMNRGIDKKSWMDPNSSAPWGRSNPSDVIMEYGMDVVDKVIN